MNIIFFFFFLLVLLNFYIHKRTVTTATCNTKRDLFTTKAEKHEIDINAAFQRFEQTNEQMNEWREKKEKENISIKMR